jgi:hypothetical protein
MTGQTGKSGVHVGNEGLLQRRGSVFALMQQKMLQVGIGSATVASSAAAAAAISKSHEGGGKLLNSAAGGSGSKGEAARGKDVDAFGSKKHSVSSSSDEDDEDDEDDDNDDDDENGDDEPLQPWRYASFSEPGETLAAAASAHVTLPPPEDRGEFVTLAIPPCTKAMASETVSEGLEQLVHMQV